MHFLKAFLNDPGAIGAISPSSQVLALAMVDDLDLQPGCGVLELGPGTGAFTAEIRSRLTSPDDYVGVERDPGFARVLRERFPDLRIVNGLAEDIGDYYERNALSPPKAILCGLPLSIQRRDSLDSIVAVADELMSAGSEFRTFFYLPALPLPPAIYFRRRMNAVFGEHRPGRVVMRNLPPATVLAWRR
ncbi:MAG: rRNA adenine N-6-methyltransferase family protein [Gammaproteobacteria bacterium]|nr:rRNA adenine N-6-methyltransferase family protein [Gammaproteobacteria bacterium]